MRASGEQEAGTIPPNSFQTAWRLRFSLLPRPSVLFIRSMTSPKKSILALLVFVAALLGGCTSKTEKDTSIPWSRPADWEGQIPGMGGGR
ncbi:MAG: hypothetical protein JWM88_2999 [Verrucomicrobia bacterium]|nr:hypothetical protein [Verrucomicrobiota bacterium]